jgi:putative addiction module killer protein
MHMFDVRQTRTFAEWLSTLSDRRARIKIADRIERASRGNLGDVKSIGGGVSEMRIAFGPGYRLYFAKRGEALIVLLCGGDKGSQRRDIEAARAMAREL